MIGDTIGVQVHGCGAPGFPFAEGCTWSISNGQVVTTQMGAVLGLSANGTSTDSVNALYGDAQGRYAASIDNIGPVGLWNGTTFNSLPGITSNPRAGQINAMSENGLLAGMGDGPHYPGWAFDQNANAYYTFGPDWTYSMGANSNGYVVGQDGNGATGFIWTEGSQTYKTVSGSTALLSLSSTNQIAGINTSGKAALFSTSGTQLATYWSGEATAVNSSGIVGGDTATSLDYYDEVVTYNGVAEAYFPGYGTVPLNHYAPNGVSFNFVQAINDAGDILVLSGDVYWGNLNGGCERTSWCPRPRPNRRRSCSRPWACSVCWPTPGGNGGDRAERRKNRKCVVGTAV